MALYLKLSNFDQKNTGWGQILANTQGIQYPYRREKCHRAISTFILFTSNLRARPFLQQVDDVLKNNCWEISF